MKFNKYKIKEKIWSLSEDYRIRDANDMEAFRVKGSRFSFKGKMAFADWQGRDLFEIERKVFSFKPTFFLLKDGQKLYKVVKQFSFKPRIIVESLTEVDAFEVRGNLWGNEYKFFKEGVEFAVVSRDIWKVAGTYGVAVMEGQDEKTVLAIVVIINMIRKMQAAGAGGGGGG